ncbi:GTP 3',8-cyclase MoaA [Desulfosoma caldarium]|uniref:GTP 3',8-cyclase n=1 Tax=Desulfosoma caldarium TaxID=610254 RepID=A0A3N1VN02_9BACT|nr:GTP 3',8-cyclase MoaA [Desulfosoma caldarium]ROR01582.1 cyclic pyranopterin monophosphate synthase subunit MoaA [Desulfosoma caldarium]
MPQELVDGYARRVDYLRLSVTDRCNLRCTYCLPSEGFHFLPHEDILRYEELLRLVAIASRLGISKVRVTGGEPLVRKGILEFLGRLCAFSQIRDVSLTTNGVLLESLVEGLWAAGVRRLNVSLDTLQPAKYEAITGVDAFWKVWRGLSAVLDRGFTPVKINVVAIRGVNDDEIEALAELTRSYPFHVRFIELMPFRLEAYEERYLSADVILQRLRAMGALLPARSENGNGPARYYQFPNAPGKIGLISPMSHHFCPSCNRLRITAEGSLRTCLFSDRDVDLRGPLRCGCSDEEIAALILEAVQKKPQRHHANDAPVAHRKCHSRPMTAIGG